MRSRSQPDLGKGKNLLARGESSSGRGHRKSPRAAEGSQPGEEEGEVGGKGRRSRRRRAKKCTCILHEEVWPVTGVDPVVVGQA